MSKIDEKLLIHEYRNREFLWNRRNSNFRNQPMRKMNLEQIARALHRDKEEIKNKWRALVKKYLTEVNWEKNGKKNRNGKMMPYKSKWKHFDAFEFYPVESKEDEQEEDNETEMEDIEDRGEDSVMKEFSEKVLRVPELDKSQEQNLMKGVNLEGIEELTEASHELFYDSLMPFVLEIPDGKVLNYRRDLVELIDKYSDLKSEGFAQQLQQVEDCITLSDDEAPSSKKKKVPVKQEVVKAELGMDQNVEMHPSNRWNHYRSPALPVQPQYCYSDGYDPYYGRRFSQVYPRYRDPYYELPPENIMTLSRSPLTDANRCHQDQQGVGVQIRREILHDYSATLSSQGQSRCNVASVSKEQKSVPQSQIVQTCPEAPVSTRNEVHIQPSNHEETPEDDVVILESSIIGNDLII